jgi:osmoprotectant transport system substrate-binding protein
MGHQVFDGGLRARHPGLSAVWVEDKTAVLLGQLEAGEIDVLAEYAATALEFANGGAGQATNDPEATTVALRAALEPKGIAALNYAEATDQNGFVVSKATADKYGLTKISDLANPAPAP